MLFFTYGLIIAGRPDSIKVSHPGFRWRMFLLVAYSKALGLIYIEIAYFFEAYCTRNQSIPAQIETSLQTLTVSL